MTTSALTPTSEQIDEWMRLALGEAALAPTHGDVPIGAVLINSVGSVVAADHNRREERNDPLAHAEILVIGSARRNDWRLVDHTLVVTLEPCVMCAGAVQQSRIARLIYGAADLKAGACWSLYNIPQDARLNHRVEMTAGSREDESAALLTEFFASKRP